MTLNASSFLKGYRAQSILSAINSSGAGSIQVYSGTLPSSCGALLGDNYLLVSIPLQNPCGYASGTTITLYSTAPALITLGGVASWARIKNGGGTIVLDCDISTVAAGTGVIQMPSTTLILSQYAEIQTFSLTEV